MTQQQRDKKTWKWQGPVAEQAQRGQSAAAFCRQRNLSAPQFYWWKKQLRESQAARFVPVQVAECTTDATGDSRIELRLRNGRSLMIGRGFDPRHLRALLAVVEVAG